MKLRILFFLLLTGHLAFAQDYYNKTVTCGACDGTGVMFWKERVTEYKDLVKSKELGWGTYQTYSYSSSYQRTKGHIGQCNVCNGKGKYKKKVWKSRPKITKIRYVSSHEMRQISYNYAKSYFKTIEDVGNGYAIVFNGVTRSLIKLKNHEKGFDLDVIAYDTHEKVLYPNGDVYLNFFYMSTGLQIIKDANFNTIYESKNHAYPTINDDIFWIADQNMEKSITLGGEVKMTELAKLKNIKTGEIYSTAEYAFPDKIENIDIDLYNKGLFRAHKWMKNADNQWVKQKGILNLKGEVIVPFNVKKILSFDEEKGMITVINEFNLIDVYNTQGLLFEEEGKVVKTCDDGSVILASRKKYISPSNGQESFVDMQTIKDGKTEESFPYIFTSCSCFDQSGWFKATLLDFPDTILVSPKNEFLSERSTTLTVDEKLKVKFEHNIIEEAFQNNTDDNRIIKSSKNGTTKYGFKEYKNGEPIFDNISSSFFNDRYFFVKKGNRFGALVRNLKRNGEIEYVLIDPIYKKIDYNNTTYDLLVLSNDAGKWGLLSPKKEPKAKSISEKEMNKPVLPFIYDSISVFGNYAYTYKSDAIEKYQINTYHNGGKSARIIEVESATFNKKGKVIKNNVSNVSSNFVTVTKDAIFDFMDGNYYNDYEAINYSKDFCVIASSSGSRLLLKLNNPFFNKESMSYEIEYGVDKIIPLKFDDKNRLYYFAVTDASNRWGIMKIGFKDYFRKTANYISTYVYEPAEGFDEFLYSNQSDINIFKDGDTYYNIDLTKIEVEKERVTIQ